MRITTYNCNSVRSRLDHILTFLKETAPDALCLQETKVQDEHFPESAFTEAGWHAVYRGQKSYNGVAIITKDPLTEWSAGLQDGDDDESAPRLILATLANGVHVLNTYVPQGRDLETEQFQFKLAWFQRLRAFLDRLSFTNRSKVLWVGDLNVAPQPKDVHDHKRIWPHVCHCQEVIDAFHEVTDWGFEDVFRKHLPDEDTFTYWDYRVKGALDRGIGWRIDHILATPSLARTSTAVTIDTDARRKEKPSDHTFVTADFEL